MRMFFKYVVKNLKNLVRAVKVLKFKNFLKWGSAIIFKNREVVKISEMVLRKFPERL